MSKASNATYIATQNRTLDGVRFYIYVPFFYRRTAAQTIAANGYK